MSPGIQEPEQGELPRINRNTNVRSTPEDDEDRTQSYAKSAILLLNLIGSWCVAGYQACVLNSVSKDFPRSLFTRQHVHLNGSCTTMFEVTNASLALFVIIIIVDLIAMCGENACILSVEFFANLTKCILGIIGVFAVLFRVDVDEVKECLHLYNCAWWSFVGIILISFCFSCFFLPDEKREGREHVKVSLNEGASYGTQAEAGKP
eukprot:TRINITY_DN61371_c0_g1_i1.p1 TRINITY_DN61371_c0_g1~~TRINITY_DN61371_c0_g1_i1.p1  ORF type:complete len:206 (-),score=29.40 TRINITY_DN61371_c0_g1_i1:98-715(-)